MLNNCHNIDWEAITWEGFGQAVSNHVWCTTLPWRKKQQHILAAFQDHITKCEVFGSLGDDSTKPFQIQSINQV